MKVPLCWMRSGRASFVPSIMITMLGLKSMASWNASVSMYDMPEAKLTVVALTPKLHRV